MVELDAGLAAQQALTQQRFGISMMKQAADTQNKMADLLAQTVMASANGQQVNITA